MLIKAELYQKTVELDISQSYAISSLKNEMVSIFPCFQTPETIHKGLDYELD